MQRNAKDFTLYIFFSGNTLGECRLNLLKYTSSLTGRAIAQKTRGPVFDSRLDCGGHFFLSPVVALFLLSVSIYISKGQVYAPRLKPAAPIRLADRNHEYYHASAPCG